MKNIPQATQIHLKKSACLTAIFLLCIAIFAYTEARAGETGDAVPSTEPELPAIQPVKPPVVQPRVAPRTVRRTPRTVINPNTSMRRVTRILRGNSGSAGLTDKFISSPKSALFSKDGKKLYINSLEGCATIVYDFPSLLRRKVISHRFNASHSFLFHHEDTLFDYVYYEGRELINRNIFSGKPVEGVFSHDGKYLWITYYRRSYDKRATSPSAIAIIDTSTDALVRVMPTGPIPKIAAVSPDGKILAVVHWGDNTVALIDITSNNPQDFHYTKRMVLRQQMDLATVSGNRDRNCGECLRGAAFTMDSRYLFVARMGGGGIAVFDTRDDQYLGSLTTVPRTPRHLRLSGDGKFLYVTSNTSGILSRFPVDSILTELRNNGNSTVQGEELFVGRGARTFVLSPDEKFAYVVSNNERKLTKVHTPSWSIRDWNGVDAYPVGLAISPDGKYLVTTSQGRAGVGGNSIGIYETGESSPNAKTPEIIRFGSPAVLP